jgi:hypothetical protein
VDTYLAQERLWDGAGGSRSALTHESRFVFWRQSRRGFYHLYHLQLNPSVLVFMSAIIEPDTFYAGCTAPRKAAWLYTVLVFMSVIIDPDTEGNCSSLCTRARLNTQAYTQRQG